MKILFDWIEKVKIGSAIPKFKVTYDQTLRKLNEKLK